MCGLLKDRKTLFKEYKQCFAAREVVHWMLTKVCLFCFSSVTTFYLLDAQGSIRKTYELIRSIQPRPKLFPSSMKFCVKAATC